VLGTSLSGIDAVVSVATAHGLFIRDSAGTLRYEPSAGSGNFRITMMSRKGLLPEADFFCPIPYEPLVHCTKDAVERLIAQSQDRLLDEVFDLFKREIVSADPDYASRIGLSTATVEDIADRYFRARLEAEPFAWAAYNLAEAKENKRNRVTVQWRYAILRMHEVIALAVPHFNDRDLKRFHQFFKTVFVDDYATVPHESLERLLALDNAGRLEVRSLGDNYQIEQSAPGAVVNFGEERLDFEAFIDATGQHALSASDLPFPSLRRTEAVKEAQTETASSGEDRASTRRTGGIDIDECFRPRVDGGVSNRLYCVSVPFLLHKLPFVQGITSAHEMGMTVSKAIVASLGDDNLLLGSTIPHDTQTSSPTEIDPDVMTPA